jgi:hypothetical protein
VSTISTTSARAILDPLLHEDRPWTVVELARETGDPIGTVDAVAELCGAGLLNHLGEEAVCASRAAVRGRRLADGEEEGA